MTAAAVAIWVWVSGGIVMVLQTPSRGPVADTVFVFTWPWHLIQHFRGRE